MSDLRIIRNIEEIIGEPLKQVSLQEFQQLERYRKEYHSSGRYEEPVFRKVFSFNSSGQVVALWMDQLTEDPMEEVKELCSLQTLMLRSSFNRLISTLLISAILPFLRS